MSKPYAFRMNILIIMLLSDTNQARSVKFMPVPARKPKSAAKKPTSKSAAKKPVNYLYRDPVYGFSITLPDSWKTYTVIKTSKKLADAEYGVFFLFKYKGKVYEDVLNLLVFKMTLEQWRNEGYDESPYIFLAERGGRIYAYTVPSELPGAFLDETGFDYDYEKYKKEIDLLQRMVNDEVPEIVKTFKLKKMPARR
ncbi:hypothetical protein [Paenibacillus sp. PK3_47]|uniref:hypothetical protein n=1 Tax=Paenibacillus sp. PK3_47 TaxID=2072642 RepID=UPI00201D8216|nr:hypothetical protein [Paenibacillus sp. PK3_47]